MIWTLSVFESGFFFYDSSVLKWVMSTLIYAILCIQSLLKNLNIVKKTHIQTQIMFLLSSFIRRQFTLIFKLMKLQFDLLRVYLIYYTLVRERHQMPVLRPLNVINIKMNWPIINQTCKNIKYIICYI